MRQRMRRHPGLRGGLLLLCALCLLAPVIAAGSVAPSAATPLVQGTDGPSIPAPQRDDRTGQQADPEATAPPGPAASDGDGEQPTATPTAPAGALTLAPGVTFG